MRPNLAVNKRHGIWRGTMSAAPSTGGQPKRRYAGLPSWVARAVVELATARFRHKKLQAREVSALNARAIQYGRNPSEASPGDAELVQEVGYVIPRVAARVPWRADCLVQAMAAQRWLEKKGIAATIAIGVDRSQSAGFEAHAWLSYGDTVVTGGETSRFTVMLQHQGKS